MLDESTGAKERRATTVITAILFLEALWIFLFKYLPLDAGLWALQAELVHQHLFGHATDTWRLIQYPAANIGAPLLSGFLTILFSGEVVTRLLLTFGAIFMRGFAMVMLFRTLRVRDETVYFLIPVLSLSGIWFTGATPYLLGETVALWVLVFFVSQNHPRRVAYWILSIGLMLVALCSALVFLMCVVVVLLILAEQRRSVHLSQGWLSEPRSVMGLLLPGAMLVLTGLLAGEPILRLSSSSFLPSGLGRLLFVLTPAPNILEATFRYGDVLHWLIAAFFGVVLLACFARAYLLAIEEATWQSRALRTAGYTLLVIAMLGPLLGGMGFETESGCIFAITLILAGSYSGGPAVRRTPADRLIYTGALITLIVTASINMFSVSAGSAAAEDVLKSARTLVRQEHQTVLEDEHMDSIRIRFVVDSMLLQNSARALVGIFSYSCTAPLYLFTEPDLLKRPAEFQPRGGLVRTSDPGVKSTTPAIPVNLGSADRYLDSTVRVLASMTKGSKVSPSFGPYVLSLQEDGGISVEKGEASYRLGIGKLRAGHPVEMAIKN